MLEKTSEQSLARRLPRRNKCEIVVFTEIFLEYIPSNLILNGHMSD